MYRLGFVGYGLRGRTMSAAFERMDLPIQVAAVADPNAEAIKKELAGSPYHAKTAYYLDAEDMYRSEKLDGVLIATRCNLHAALAKQAYLKGPPVFLEKPVCTDTAGFETLLKFVHGPGEKTVVSFPLRMTAIVQEMKRIVSSGTLGDIVAVQAINNVPYGSVYYHSWYRDSSITGGLFLQKMTHDIDYILYICGERISTVFAMTSLMHFKGDKPVDLKCPECPEYYTCSESSYVVSKFQHETPNGDYCCFTHLTGNDDSVSVLFKTERGVIINYSQVVIVKKSAGRRGARFIGTKGSAEFDFYSGTIRQDSYFTGKITTQKFTDVNTNHFGGDDALAFAFFDVMRGKKSAAPLLDGLVSAQVCLAAKESAAKGQCVNITQVK